MPDALPLAAGQAVGAGVSEAAEPHRLEQLERPVDVARGEAPQPRRERRHVPEASAEDVLHHRQALHEVVLLEHHADVAPHRAQLAFLQAGEVPAVEDDLARGRLDQPVDAADQRRLAGARRPDHRGDPAGGEIQRDAGEHRLAGDVRLDETADRERRRGGHRRRGGCILHRGGGNAHFFSAAFFAAASASRFCRFSNAALLNFSPLPSAT